jgi:hypothetical protein
MREYHAGFASAFSLQEEYKRRFLRCLSAYFFNEVTEFLIPYSYANACTAMSILINKADEQFVKIGVGFEGTPLIISQMEDVPRIMQSHETLNYYCVIRAFMEDRILPHPTIVRTLDEVAAELPSWVDALGKMGYTASIGHRGMPIFAKREETDNRYVGPGV